MNNALYLLGFSPKLSMRDPAIATIESRETGISDTGEAEYFDPKTLALAELFDIERLDAGLVFAWFKRLDRSEFLGEEGARNLADIDWLTPRVMAHEEAVGLLSSQSSFYPARFGSLFSSDAALQSYSVSATPRLKEFFQLIKGKQEWGLKLYGNYAQAAQMQAERNGLLQEGVPLKGANYLKLKQLQRELSRSDSGVFVQSLKTAMASIQEVFAHTQERSINAATKSDAKEELLSSVAVLEWIESTSQVAFWVEQWNLDSSRNGGLRMELSGPWPAYSFCPSLPAFSDPIADPQVGSERRAA
jgi:hypothetical protein